VSDPTEGFRRAATAALNAEAAAATDPRAELSAKYGQLWDTQEMQAEFSVSGFMAPFVGVTRKADGVKGTLLFSHSPRFYHSFSPA